MEAFDLYAPEIDADPFPYYEILREQHPCYWSESGRLWILSRYDDIVQAARDWETFSSSQGNMIDELPGRAGATLGTTDPPRHDRLRALSQAAFTRKTAEQLVAPTPRDRRSRARAHLRQRQLRVHRRLLQPDHGRAAVPHHGPARARSRGDPAQGHPGGVDRQVGQGPQSRAHRRLQGAERLHHRRGRGAAKASHRRSHHPPRRGRDRRRPLERAGNRAHRRHLRDGRGGIAVELHEHARAQSARSSRGARPYRRGPFGLLEPAIEESLRFNTSAQRFKRTVMRECTLHGRTLRIGDTVALAFGAGNRDRRKFSDPDVYDIARRPQGHLGFGAGKHFCLGSQMARLVTQVAMRRFLERVPEFHLTTGKLAWNSSSNFRSPVALPFAVR